MISQAIEPCEVRERKISLTAKTIASDVVGGKEPVDEPVIREQIGKPGLDGQHQAGSGSTTDRQSTVLRRLKPMRDRQALGLAGTPG